MTNWSFNLNVLTNSAPVLSTIPSEIIFIVNQSNSINIVVYDYISNTPATELLTVVFDLTTANPWMTGTFDSTLNTVTLSGIPDVFFTHALTLTISDCYNSAVLPINVKAKTLPPSIIGTIAAPVAI